MQTRAFDLAVSAGKLNCPVVAKKTSSAMHASSAIWKAVLFMMLLTASESGLPYSSVRCWSNTVCRTLHLHPLLRLEHPRVSMQ